MKKVDFTPKTDIEEYLNNDFNIQIYENLTEDDDLKGIFEPLEYLNLLNEQFEIVKANKEKPLSVVKHLLGLNLNETQLHYLLYDLRSIIYNYSGDNREPKDRQLIICREFIEKEYDKLESKLYPKTENEHEPENKYDFEKVRYEIENYEAVKDKIHYLLAIKTEYLQNRPMWDIPTATPFDKKCDLEIAKLKELAGMDSVSTTQKAKPRFMLSDKKGAKIDLIRVLNALYELRLIVKSNGQIPTKQEFIKSLGEFLGTDLSKYHSNLSQAFKNQPLEVNLKVFEDMKAATQKTHYTNEN